MGGDCCEGLLGLVYSRELKDLGFGLGFWTWISGLRACVSGLGFGVEATICVLCYETICVLFWSSARLNQSSNQSSKE